MIKHKTTIRARYSETDQMGVIYHGNYAKYLDIGRTEWLRNIGVSYSDMEKSGTLLPVISLQINYLKSAFYDDELTIVTKIKKTPLVKIEFDYEIINQNNELICTGNTILAFLNKASKKPIRCPEYILNKLKL